jgi:hypothetical protein
MPWYYASSESKPVGPVSMEELHALRANGVVSPETYVIEHTGAPDANWSWKRYKDVFPAISGLPPVLPSIPSQPWVPPVPPSVPAPAAHPTFASAAPNPGPSFTAPPAPIHSYPGPDPYYRAKPTNPWCAWGFGLGLASFFLLFACGIGVFFTVPAILLSVIGLVHVYHDRNQSGRGFAIGGLFLAGLTLLLCVIFVVMFAHNVKRQEWTTVTEQSSIDSE